VCQDCAGLTLRIRQRLKDRRADLAKGEYRSLNKQIEFIFERFLSEKSDRWPNGERDLPIWQPPPTPKSEQKEAEGDALFQMYNPPMLGLLGELDEYQGPVVVGATTMTGMATCFWPMRKAPRFGHP
jgi:hypothetical protein